MKSRPFRNLPALAAGALLVAACSGKDDAARAFTDRDSLLRYVPADAPYVVYTGEPLPDDLVDGLQPKMDRLLAAQRELLRESYRAGRAAGPDARPAAEQQATDALFEAVLSLLSPEGFEKAGLDRNSRMVFFGNGLLPVMRIELRDEAAFETAIADLETAAGKALDTTTIGTTEFRYAGDEEGRLVIGVADGNAVLTFVPRQFSEEQTRELLGLSLPGKSIAQTKVLSDIASKYDFSSHYIGFVDTRRLAATFLEQPAGLDAALLGGLEFDATKVSAVCRDEIRDVVEIAPRMVFGYQEIGLERISGSLVVELRPDIAGPLTGVAALVPGLGIDQGGLLSFGFSVDLPAWRSFLEARLDALEADPFECEYFAEVRAGVQKGREWLATPVPPVAYGFRGFNAIVESLEGFDLASRRPPTSVDASIVVAMNDPSQLLAAGAMFSPQIAAMDLKPDGVPRALAVPQLQAVGEEAYAAMLDNALAISVGRGAEARVARVLAAGSAEPPPVFGVTMDAGKYYELVGSGVTMEPADAGDGASSPQTQAAVAEMMKVLGEVYDRMATTLRFSVNGAELHTEVTLEEL